MVVQEWASTSTRSTEMAITIDILGMGGVQDALDKVLLATDPEPIADEAGALLFSNIVTRFRDQIDADGVAWAPLSKYSIKDRIALGFNGPDPILYRTGQLLNSIQLVKDGAEAAIVTTDERAGILNFGGTNDKGLEVPGRSFMDYNQTDTDLMFELTVRRITETLGALS